MEQVLLQKSIKLKLEQPAIMCEGRKPVTCYYRGKLIEGRGEYWHIRIKSYGKELMVSINKETGNCVTEGWQDLKIVK